MGNPDRCTGYESVTLEVVPLREAAETPLELVGRKARTLGLLMRSGFDIPAGFVVAPETPLDQDGLNPYLDELGGDVFVVRSSGASEDSADTSLAGMYLSVLDVKSDDVLEAISDVRASVNQSNNERLPVLIQRMIDPICAGVAFTADPVTGDRDTTAITATRGVADRLLAGEIAGDDWQVNGRTASPTRQSEGALSRRLALRVARTARQIANEMGTPQDVEWAWDGKTLWVVQARPITGLPAPVSWKPPARGFYQRSLRFGEWIPMPVTPLFESWLLTTMERRLHEHLNKQIGQVAPEPLHVIVNGWYYYSLNWLPVPGIAFRRNFFSIIRRVWKDWRIAAPMFPQTVRYGYERCETDWRHNVLPRYRATVSSYERRIRDLNDRELIGLIDDLASEAGSYFGSITTVAGSAYKFEQQLAAFWNTHLRKELGVSHMVALQGFDMPPEIRSTPRLESLDWAVPPMPPQHGSIDNDGLRARRRKTVERAEEILAHSNRRLRKFRRLLAEAQHVVPVREEQLGQLSLPWPVMREAIHKLAATLVDSSSIGTTEDIYFLTKSEVVSLLDEPRPMDAVVAERRQDRARASRLTPPVWVGRVPWTVKLMFSYSNRLAGASQTDTAIVHGIPSSPGRATGPVRVIRDSSQFAEFEDGEVLVAPLTAPAWTELFGRASAIVTDVGSALAHASIIAREYGIPAVVGCGDATARLKDGQLVTVDGSTGNVEPSMGPTD